ncbi:MAG TPA: alpha-glucan family phosphorylase [Acidobacteriaceae bacterium]|nr:alpha-glucan family phosphorylase [Acidobacteriaceae bacterium]
MSLESHQEFSSFICAEQDGVVAYFSMEIALASNLPTYSGGLGVLAGDTLRSAADLGLQVSAVTLLHRKGYFRQHLDLAGVQTEEEQPWDFEKLLTLEAPIVEVTIEGRPVLVRAWRYDLEGVTGHIVPVYLLDTGIEQNDPRDRVITDHLYGGDGDYRLKQEAVLGIGGVRILQALRHPIQVFHMNEGHAALLTAALMERQLDGDLNRALDSKDVEAVRSRCVFTTHTPVPAGHDRFSMEQTYRILGDGMANLLRRMGGFHEDILNMTYVALASSRFVNGVAMQHGKISREMFPDYSIDAITNGVHAGTWTSPSMQALLDRRVPRWRQDNVQLRYMIDVPTAEIRQAHAEAKRLLIREVADRTGATLHSDVFTIGFARRVATYKRADLLFSDPARLVRCAQQSGGLQILYGGKAHPHDDPAKGLIRRIFDVAAEVKSDALKIIYLENYEWELASLLTSGVDLWLNTPRRPYEASGTSGMKAALNGVPSLSILDGWWIEGCLEGYTGWAIPDRETQEEESAALYDQLETKVLPLYYDRPEEWGRLMRSTIALNGSFFNTQRMLQQYIANAYYPESNINVSVAALESVLAR